MERRTARLAALAWGLVACGLVGGFAAVVWASGAPTGQSRTPACRTLGISCTRDALGSPVGPATPGVGSKPAPTKQAPAKPSTDSIGPVVAVAAAAPSGHATTTATPPSVAPKVTVASVHPTTPGRAHSGARGNHALSLPSGQLKNVTTAHSSHSHGPPAGPPGKNHGQQGVVSLSALVTEQPAVPTQAQQVGPQAQQVAPQTQQVSPKGQQSAAPGYQASPGHQAGPDSQGPPPAHQGPPGHQGAPPGSRGPPSGHQAHQPKK